VYTRLERFPNVVEELTQRAVVAGFILRRPGGTDIAEGAAFGRSADLGYNRPTRWCGRFDRETETP
jgi:hypothetical protein